MSEKNEVTVEGKVFTVWGATNTMWQHLEATSGKKYCGASHGRCGSCEKSRPGHDAHYFDSGLPEKDFTDDQGNSWQYAGVVREESSDSYGWYENTHRWYCENPKYRVPLDIEGARAEILEKVPDMPDWAVFKIARMLGIQL